MNLSEEERNRIRCSVALSVPLVLNYITHPDPDRYQSISHMVPTYELCGIPPEAEIDPYFTPWKLSDTGKKRVYVNSNGYRIRFLTYAMVKKFKDSMFEIYGKGEGELVQKLIDCLGSRWVVMKGGLDKNGDWLKFVNSLVVVEKNESRDNHPPVGDGMYAVLDAFFGTPADGQVIQNFFIDPMKESVSLYKYELSTLKPKIAVSHTEQK